MDGHPLKQVISLSGLPSEDIEPWLIDQVTSRGYHPQEMKLEDLRDVLADILQDLILGDPK